jgi:hypothetical protein
MAARTLEAEARMADAKTLEAVGIDANHAAYPPL